MTKGSIKQRYWVQKSSVIKLCRMAQSSPLPHIIRFNQGLLIRVYYQYLSSLKDCKSVYIHKEMNIKNLKYFVVFRHTLLHNIKSKEYLV